MRSEKLDKKLNDFICSPEELEKYFDLSDEDKKLIDRINKLHPMRIPAFYLSLIEKLDPSDPLAKMAFPMEAELSLKGSYDTSGELSNTVMPGLQHKYKQTALVLATNQCGLYCRHCFRKRLVGLDTDETIKRLNEAVKYISDHKEINNVLISGGDPFVLPTEVLSEFIEKLSHLKHLRFVRIGTRSVVAFPERILKDKKLLDLFRKYSIPERRMYVVVQINHPKEISRDCVKAVDKLIRSNVILNNQAVLLRDVNDNPAVMAELLNQLTSIGISPYYVFQCRPVKMVKNNFQVPLKEGYEILEGARKLCNGLSKRFRYVMSHRTGKIEIMSIQGRDIYLKYLQAKSAKNNGIFFKKKLAPGAGWLDDLK